SVREVPDDEESAIGGMDVDTTYEGRERYRVNVRYPRELRDNLEALRDVLVPIAPLSPRTMGAVDGPGTTSAVAMNSGGSMGAGAMASGGGMASGLSP